MCIFRTFADENNKKKNSYGSKQSRRYTLPPLPFRHGISVRNGGKTASPIFYNDVFLQIFHL